MRKYVSEFIGTFFLVFGGTSAVLGHALVDFGAAANVVIPFAFGLSLVVGIFALGHISGGHFNPAVSIAFAFNRHAHFPWSEVWRYVVAQLLGATAASGVLALVFGGAAAFTTGPTVPNAAAPFTVAPEIGVFAFEVFATFLLMFVITAVATDSRIQGVPAGLAIGFTVAAMIFAMGWVGGGSLNPARSFGPALIGNVWEAHWLYWIAPCLGAIAAVFVYSYIRTEPIDAEPDVMRDPTLRHEQVAA